jgi:hypothetical protein
MLPRFRSVPPCNVLGVCVWQHARRAALRSDTHGVLRLHGDLLAAEGVLAWPAGVCTFWGAPYVQLGSVWPCRTACLSLLHVQSYAASFGPRPGRQPMDPELRRRVLEHQDKNGRTLLLLAAARNHYQIAQQAGPVCVQRQMLLSSMEPSACTQKQRAAFARSFPAW